MKKLISLFAVITIFGIMSLFAQPGGPGGGPGGGDPPVGVPIDGGAAALLVAGAVYGARKLKKKRDLEKAEKQAQQQDTEQQSV